MRCQTEARPLSSPALRNHIGDLLDELAEFVRDGGATVGSALVGLAEVHALDRLDAGFDVRTVLWELGAIRDKVGEGFAGRVAAEKAPLLVHSAANDPMVHNPFLKEVKIRALYGVPLVHENEVVGIAEVGSRSAFDFSPDDKQLFRAMAQRATSLRDAPAQRRNAMTPGSLPDVELPVRSSRRSARG